MIRPTPYRRPRLEHEGCETRLAVSAALACHKGDASQTTSPTQTGAQTGGVVLSGVTVNQGGSPSRSGSASGRGGDGGASGASSGGTNTITIATDANLPAAITALQTALDEAATANQQTASIAQAAIDASTGIPTALSTIAQKFAVWAAIGAGLFLAWWFLFKKQNA